MATEVHTYNGNKIYDAEFTNWFNNWFNEVAEEMDWKLECKLSYVSEGKSSYVSDQQKEEIFLAYQEGLTDNMKLLRKGKEDEIVRTIDLKLYETRQEFADRLEEFKEKYNFSNLDDLTQGLIFQALFKNDEGKIEDIAKKIKEDDEDVQLHTSAPKRCSNGCCVLGEDIELINEHIDSKVDYIDEWFKKHNFSVKELLKITLLATKKLDKMLN